VRSAKVKKSRILALPFGDDAEWTCPPKPRRRRMFGRAREKVRYRPDMDLLMDVPGFPGYLRFAMDEQLLLRQV